MGGILIGLLVDVVVIVVTALIAFAIGKQGRTTELVERESQIESLRHHLERKTATIDYLRAECDHYQARMRRLEGHLVAGAHLNAIPPRIMRSKDIDPAIVGKFDPLPDIPEDVRLRMEGALAEQNRFRRAAQLPELPDASAEAFGLAVIKQKKET